MKTVAQPNSTLPASFHAPCSSFPLLACSAQACFPRCVLVKTRRPLSRVTCATCSAWALAPRAFPRPAPSPCRRSLESPRARALLLLNAALSTLLGPPSAPVLRAVSRLRAACQCCSAAPSAFKLQQPGLHDAAVCAANLSLPRRSSQLAESSPLTRWVWHGKKPVRSPSPTASASQNTPVPYYADKLLSPPPRFGRQQNPRAVTSRESRSRMSSGLRKLA